MTKQEQQAFNAIAYKHFTKALQELQELREREDVKFERLRTCQAWVYETENYFLLLSYRTFVACIRKDNDILYDVLRTEYGYTSTSSHHICKFAKDYSAGKYGCEVVVRADNVVW